MEAFRKRAEPLPFLWGQKKPAPAFERQLTLRKELALPYKGDGSVKPSREGTTNKVYSELYGTTPASCASQIDNLHEFLTGNDGHPPALLSATGYVFIAEGMKSEFLELKGQRHVDAFAFWAHVPQEFDLRLQDEVSSNWTTPLITLAHHLTQTEVETICRDLILKHAAQAKNRDVYCSSQNSVNLKPYVSYYPHPTPSGSVPEYKPFVVKFKH